uniref:Uncharacterized protein n=1 Tax=Sphaerodactylus townsendi TaxID=933632 RepID=A0ACB8FVU4_9SAUR
MQTETYLGGDSVSAETADNSRSKGGRTRVGEGGAARKRREKPWLCRKEPTRADVRRRRRHPSFPDVAGRRCHDRKGDSQPYQALKYSSKSHPSGGDHRHDKMRDATDPSPPNKMLRRSDSPENKYVDNTGHSKAKSMHTHRVRERDGVQCYLLWVLFPFPPNQLRGLSELGGTFAQCRCKVAISLLEKTGPVSG